MSEYRKYKELIKIEVYLNQKCSLLKKIQHKYFTPNTNVVYLIRRQQLFWNLKGLFRLYSKLIYLKIYRKYNCCVFPDAIIGKGLHIHHPIGIVIGHCNIGDNFTIMQNCTIGEKNIGEYSRNRTGPKIGNNVTIGVNSCILGAVSITNNVVIGANSVVNKSVNESGIYAGTPIKFLSKYDKG